MFDPFDAFDPFDPVPAERGEAEGQEQDQEQETSSGFDPAQSAAAEPDLDPGDAAISEDEEPFAREPTPPTPRPGARRWATTASRPVQPGSPASPEPQRRTTQDRPAPAPTLVDESTPLLDLPGSIETTPTPPVAHPVEDEPEPEEDGTAPEVSLADLAAFRAAALSELRAGAERLRAHGHDATVTDALDRDEPSLAVRFRPDPGPLSQPSDADPARFELRLAADLDGGTQVVAGFARASADAPFTLLGRTHVEQMDRSWVARRFLEFVQKSLDLR